jgi:hypothetical protein
MQIGTDGTRLTGVYPFNDSVLLFKEYGMYTFEGATSFSTTTAVVSYDQTTFTYSLLFPGITVLSPYGIVPLDDSLYVWGASAVYRVRQSELNKSIAPPNTLSSNITATIVDTNTSGTDVVGIYDLDNRQVWYNGSETPSSLVRDSVICYNVDANSWCSFRRNYAHNTYANVIVNGSNLILSGGYGANSYVYVQNSTTTFDGEAIPFQYSTPFSITKSGYLIQPKYVTIDFTSTSNEPLFYNYAYDLKASVEQPIPLAINTPQSTWNSGQPSVISSWGSTLTGNVGTYSTATYQTRQFRIYNKGRRLRHTIYSSGMTGTCDIIAITTSYTLIGDKGLNAY